MDGRIAIAAELGVGKTQILTVVQEKEIMRKWEAGERADVKYSEPRTADNEDILKLCGNGSREPDQRIFL